MLNKICDCVYTYESDDITDLVNAALAAGIPAREILLNGLTKGMEAVGESFKEGDYFVPEVLMAAQTMADGLEIIKPLLAEDQDEGVKRGKVVIGTVKGDVHDIGKKLVAMFMEGAGYDVVDLGIEVPAETFIEQALALNADYLCMSAMLTTTMKQMNIITGQLKDQAADRHITPVVGGAPVTQKFAEELGARFAFDAAAAVDLLKSLDETNV